MKYILPTLSLFIILSFSSVIEIQTVITSPTISYPVRFAYIDTIKDWWPPEKIAAGLGVPGYAVTTMYNYIAFSFWTYKSGPLDIVSLWYNPTKYFGTTSVFGISKD